MQCAGWPCFGSVAVWAWNGFSSSVPGVDGSSGERAFIHLSFDMSVSNSVCGSCSDGSGQSFCSLAVSMVPVSVSGSRTHQQVFVQEGGGGEDNEIPAKPIYLERQKLTN